MIWTYIRNRKLQYTTIYWYIHMHHNYINLFPCKHVLITVKQLLCFVFRIMNPWSRIILCPGSIVRLLLYTINLFWTLNCEIEEYQWRIQRGCSRCPPPLNLIECKKKKKKMAHIAPESITNPRASNASKRALNPIREGLCQSVFTLAEVRACTWYFCAPPPPAPKWNFWIRPCGTVVANWGNVGGIYSAWFFV